MLLWWLYISPWVHDQEFFNYREDEFLGHKVCASSILYRNSQIASLSGSSNASCHSLGSTNSRYSALSDLFFHLSRLMGRKWYFIMVLICISRITIEIEFLLIHSLTIHFSTLGNLPFIFFAWFLIELQ